MHIQLMLQFLANGICQGAVLGFVALGFGLIFFAARTFHVAHGVVYATAGVLCYAFLVGVGWPLPVAVVCSVALGGALGCLIEAWVYFPLISPWTRLRRKRLAGSLFEPSSTIVMMSSLGTYVAIVNVLAIFFGNETRVLQRGIQPTHSFAGVILTRPQIIQFIAFVAVVLLMWALLRGTRLGRILRALADDPELICVLGYDLRKLRLVVFAMGSILASIGGVLAALDVGVSPHVGFRAVLVGAVAAILGGFGNLLAPALGALILGLVNSLVIWQASARWSDAVVFGLLILILLFRPQGLLAMTRRAEET